MTILRCLFQGAKGRFNVTSENRNVTGALYVHATTLRKQTIRLLGSITDSKFRDLGHEDNSFAVSVRLREFFSDGNLSLYTTRRS